ncbi:MAG: hypothetical protein KatS3mg118_2598 [Paracoccaceae bacterium]|nr:MAG: hypothetical protein KatS3mg118_2598 [Paracoccaceae bacterium]
MGGVLAEHPGRAGCEVVLVTPAARVSDWTFNTLEQHAIQKRLLELGVELVLQSRRGRDRARACGLRLRLHRGDARDRCDAVVMVASRVGNDALYRDLRAREGDWADAGIRSVRIIGDAEAPGPIAWATYAGHRYARELDTPEIGDALPFRREITELWDE